MKKNQLMSKADLKLVSDLNAAMQHEKHRGLWWSVVFLGVFIVTFIVWAYFSELEEVVRGQGAIIPSSRQQMIQSLDPGILQSLNVREGQLVDKGYVVATLDDTRSSAIVREIAAKVDNLEATLARYRAEAYGEPLTFPEDVSETLIRRETTAYNARQKTLNEGIAGLKKSKAILDEQIARTAQMVKRGVSSQIELLRMQRESADLALQITERENQYKSEANDQVVRLASELAQARENLVMHEDPVAKSKIRSPVRGIVNNIKINTIGGVISAGEDIMEIVPVDDNLLVQAYIKPRDVAFVYEGLPAVVKLSAYDYSIYGGLDGKVILISPDTLSDERRASELNLDADKSYYRVIVETKGSTITDKNGNPMPIRPGMPATIDIKTGEKTVFDYLIKPFTRFKQALTER